MDFDYTDFMPFDLQRFLTMVIVAGPVLLACFWIMDLAHRKDGVTLLFVGGALLYLFDHRDSIQLPGF